MDFKTLKWLYPIERSWILRSDLSIGISWTPSWLEDIDPRDSVLTAGAGGPSSEVDGERSTSGTLTGNEVIISEVRSVAAKNEVLSTIRNDLTDFLQEIEDGMSHPFLSRFVKLTRRETNMENLEYLCKGEFPPEMESFWWAGRRDGTLLESATGDMNPSTTPL